MDKVAYGKKKHLSNIKLNPKKICLHCKHGSDLNNLSKFLPGIEKLCLKMYAAENRHSTCTGATACMPNNTCRQCLRDSNELGNVRWTWESGSE